jgi:hypothetical protein
MPITLNGSGTITGVSSLATALVNPVVTTTMGVGNATPAASGAGITFPAAVSASSDANTLDDYEEGTWTPTVTSVSGSITAYTATGAYTRIGRMVQVSITIVVTTVGTASGGAVTSLPFALGSGTAMTGREVAVLGNIVMAGGNSGLSTVSCFDGRSSNGNFFVGGNGLTVYVTGAYYV